MISCEEGFGSCRVKIDRSELGIEWAAVTKLREAKESCARLKHLVSVVGGLVLTGEGAEKFGGHFRTLEGMPSIVEVYAGIIEQHRGAGNRHGVREYADALASYCSSWLELIIREVPRICHPLDNITLTGVDRFDRSDDYFPFKNPKAGDVVLSFDGADSSVFLDLCEEDE
ncbi:hypothetical protein HN446_03260 [bacterium]|nr:hypothetical protein [bacterium]